MNWLAKRKNKALVVDDDPSVLAVLGGYMKAFDFEVETTENPRTALELCRRNRYDIIMSDLVMPQMNGLEFLQEVRQADSDAAFIMITGYPSIESAVEAIRRGAHDYITKPFRIEEVKVKIDRALLEKNLKTRLRHLQGITWALIISIPLWLVLGIVLARSMR
ncbi:MAG TPA: response regulator [Syntrophales bacterium]|nr:response regulator [Syntrophales bacterium]